MGCRLGRSDDGAVQAFEFLYQSRLICQYRRPRIAPCLARFDDLLEGTVSLRMFINLCAGYCSDGPGQPQNGMGAHTLANSLSALSKSFSSTDTWLSSADRFINLPNCRCIVCMIAVMCRAGRGRGLQLAIAVNAPADRRFLTRRESYKSPTTVDWR